MTQATSPIDPAAPAKPTVPVSSNVYTVLMAITAIVLLLGVGVMWYYNTQATGQSNPFAIEPNKTVSPR